MIRRMKDDVLSDMPPKQRLFPKIQYDEDAQADLEHVQRNFIAPARSDCVRQRISPTIDMTESQVEYVFL